MRCHAINSVYFASFTDYRDDIFFLQVLQRCRDCTPAQITTISDGLHRHSAALRL
jgi:hypothetical protein